MSSEAELAAVREQVTILAEQVFSLVEEISRQTEAGTDTDAARGTMDILENLMRKLHVRQSRLKNLLN